MHLDVVDLRKFYHSTPLGRMVQRSLRERLATLWPDTRGMTVAGFGFTTPFMRPFVERSARVLCLMPAQQGVCPWPDEGPNHAALIEETLWPLPNGFVDRLMVVHGLETCERPQALLDEIWRVLAPGGRAAFIVPNRAGLWARRDVTPFGYGRPYSVSQLERTLAQHRFAAERHGGALYHPPSHRRFWLRLAPAMERIGSRLDAERLAGVVLVEATKLVYIAPASGAKETARRPLRVLEGLAPPRPKPAAGRDGRMRTGA
ncbi:methyltransferase domain-containing protein [Limibaculum sp. M0105]|uniref:Methyltransferase domain-containing protein n=1 Tax=Thermohalobaculum xanthum TaxID=2753746 RepID=A0A8J7M7D3_9RHOB|nr:methyltransferase domain-containing protein [Thermohalobaculum xanthum]MBK0399651.1 methyltransferase domain-containing protein [Thermohalobaculum xanthum]